MLYQHCKEKQPKIAKNSLKIVLKIAKIWQNGKKIVENG
jgi:hypothetical protein